MTVERVPFIAGNWKMNLDHQQAIALVQKLAWTLADANHDYAKTEVAVFPPFTDLRTVQTLLDAEKFEIKLGAQDLSQFESGAYTGEISGAFLKKLDVRYVIIGHSERRNYHHEDDETVKAKVAAAFRHDLVPVICVGETQAELDQHGPSAIPVAQLKAALSGQNQVGEFVVAYEPVWAIGTGLVATPDQAAEVARKLRETIAEALSPEIAEMTRILYGGSVKAANVAGFLKSPEVDGVLVGGASLQVDEFSGIVRFLKHLSL
ncbi:MAG: triose-phosphate isomerase [Micrococcales bacterium]|nr:triose-phosphate isomerase [Micrococcales bacterium]NBR54558.1 triose-phosphate isomerase [Micrococcales bacterium]NBR60580.1 triose-phosphate isomerase [Actinomycetota bacterium]NBY44302.1 triose-phosphate isomerase [Micrococcales bacterium]